MRVSFFGVQFSGFGILRKIEHLSILYTPSLFIVHAYLLKEPLLL